MHAVEIMLNCVARSAWKKKKKENECVSLSEWRSSRIVKKAIYHRLLHSSLFSTSCYSLTRNRLDWLGATRIVKQNIYLHRLASSSREITWSQLLGEAVAEPYLHYGTRYVVKARNEDIFCLLSRLSTYCCSWYSFSVLRPLWMVQPFRMIDRWKLFQYFWRRELRLVTGTFLETILVVGDRILIRAIPGSVSGTVPFGVLWKLKLSSKSRRW